MPGHVLEQPVPHEAAATSFASTGKPIAHSRPRSSRRRLAEVVLGVLSALVLPCFILGGLARPMAVYSRSRWAYRRAVQTQAGCSHGRRTDGQRLPEAVPRAPDPCVHGAVAVVPVLVPRSGEPRRAFNDDELAPCLGSPGVLLVARWCDMDGGDVSVHGRSRPDTQQTTKSLGGHRVVGAAGRATSSGVIGASWPSR